MSRSYAKGKYFSYHGKKSQKEEKRQGNRELRRKSRILLGAIEYNPDLVFPIMDEVLNPYSMRRDGKLTYWPYKEDRWLWFTQRFPLYQKIPAYWFYYRLVLRK